jgi:hypothetical protein
MLIDFRAKEITLKLVYYGPALSGKTTNLQAIHRLINPDSTGRLMTLDTRDDRTLFFDLLPISIDSPTGLSLRLKLFTVPGQVMHNATRRLVLKGADGVAFIADSRRAQSDANQDSLRNLRENLRENGLDADALPTVIQYNKRDLPDAWTKEELAKISEASREPVYEAVAIQGEGVGETLFGLFARVWAHLEKEHRLGENLGTTARDVNLQLRSLFGEAPGSSPLGEH